MGKFVILDSFAYRGKDGKDKPVRVGPGEEVPPMDSSLLKHLVEAGKIGEISSETGQVIPRKKAFKLKDNEMDSLLKRSKPALQNVLTRVDFDKESLAKLLIRAEKVGAPEQVRKIIEERLER